PDMAGEDGAVIQLETAGGAAVSVFASFAMFGAPATQFDQLDILGDRGAIRLDGPALSRRGPNARSHVYDLVATYQGSYDATIGHFVRSLRD
ncbi:hypothetical protein, partial [Stenotrophomonas maltophilia]|uniref:hypothetical protein n=1 Tax=Stenotrophomonas maltophilia TaxID=40324 RepID=UPI0019545008